MGLTSGLFIDLTIAAAVAGIAGTVWLWPRIARQRIGPIAARLGLVAVSQALAVIALLAWINGYFMFFGSWSALFGSGPVASAASAGGPHRRARSRSPALTWARSPAAARSCRRPSTGGLRG